MAKITDLKVTIHVAQPAAKWRVKLLVLCARMLRVPLRWSGSSTGDVIKRELAKMEPTDDAT